MFFAPHFVLATKAKFAAKFVVGRFHTVEYKNPDGTPLFSNGHLDAIDDENGEMVFSFPSKTPSGVKWIPEPPMELLSENVTEIDDGQEAVLSESYQAWKTRFLAELKENRKEEEKRKKRR